MARRTQRPLRERERKATRAGLILVQARVGSQKRYKVAKERSYPMTLTSTMVKMVQIFSAESARGAMDVEELVVEAA